MTKNAAIERLSNELIQDADPSILEVAARSMVRKIGLGLDLAVFEGTGSNQPTGLKNTSGVQTVAAGGALANLDVFADAIGLLAQANAEANAIVMHPVVWRAISKLKEAPTCNNKPLVLHGLGSESTDAFSLWDPGLAVESAGYE